MAKAKQQNIDTVKEKEKVVSLEQEVSALKEQLKESSLKKEIQTLRAQIETNKLEADKKYTTAVHEDYLTQRRRAIAQDKLNNSRIVKVRFSNNENPGGVLKFPLKLYPGPLEWWMFEDGKDYEIPLYVAKHINVNTAVKIHEHTVNKDGKPSMQVGFKKNRFTFQSLDIIDPTSTSSLNASGTAKVYEVESR